MYLFIIIYLFYIFVSQSRHLLLPSSVCQNYRSLHYNHKEESPTYLTFVKSCPRPKIFVDTSTNKSDSGSLNFCNISSLKGCEHSAVKPSVLTSIKARNSLTTIWTVSMLLQKTSAFDSGDNVHAFMAVASTVDPEKDVRLKEGSP